MAGKTVTRTFSSGQLITIPTSGTASLYPATIKVQGLTRGQIQKVTVTFTNVDHSFPSELDILLAAPNGRATILMSDVGGEWLTVVAPVSTLTFDDNAPSPIPAPLVSGGYKPSNLGTGSPDIFPGPAPTSVTGSSLAEFNGGNPNGTWALYVVDDTNLDGGSIASWSLKITARIKGKAKPKRKRSR